MKKFTYNTTPEEIRNYILGLGFQTQDVYNKEANEVIGFTVIGTAVRLGYNTLINGKLAGHGSISMLITSTTNQEEADLSAQLYQKLYKRFRKR